MDHRRGMIWQHPSYQYMPTGGTNWGVVILDILGILFFMFLSPRLTFLIKDQRWWVALLFLAVYFFVCGGTTGLREAVRNLVHSIPQIQAPYIFSPFIHLLSLPYGFFIAGVAGFHFGIGEEMHIVWQFIALPLVFLAGLLYSFSMGMKLEGEIEPFKPGEYSGSTGMFMLVTALLHSMSMVVWLAIAEGAERQVDNRFSYFYLACGWMICLLVTTGLPRFHFAAVERDRVVVLSFLLSLALFSWVLAGRASGTYFYSLP